jgi:hypothetical protein
MSTMELMAGKTSVSQILMSCVFKKEFYNILRNFHRKVMFLKGLMCNWRNQGISNVPVNKQQRNLLNHQKILVPAGV